MSSLTGALILFAAVLHASWNALLHGHRDRFLAMTWMGVAMAAVATVTVLRVPAPPAAAWPWIVASGLVHIVYNMSLVRAYEAADLSQAYAVARGSSPLLVTLGAAVMARETIGTWQVLGIAMISGGIVLLSVHGKGLARGAVQAALRTGALIALYTVIDGIGVRASNGQALAYAAWLFLFFWFMPVLFVARRGPGKLRASLREGARPVVWALVGGLVSVGAYGIVIWAMQSGPMGAVSALRETSVVFAALLGRVFLREAVSRVRWLACAVVAAGAVCLGL